MASKCVEQSVCILQSELLGKDEAVRDVLKKKGFSIKQQALVTLRHEDASLFIHEVSRPRLTSRLPSSRPTSSPPSSARSASSRAEVNNEDTSSSEEKISTPRDPTIVSARKDEPSDFECPEDAILALSKGPLIVLVLEKENAIKDLIELVGPSNPDLWTSAPASSSLRAKFGLNAQTLGVRCSKHESTVTQEIEFLFDRSGSGNRENRRRSEMGRMVKSAEVSYCL
jgi:saccharopepsin